MNLSRILEINDIYTSILAFIGYNKNSSNLPLVSKTISGIVTDYGFVNQMSIFPTDDMFTIIQRFNSHRRTIRELTIFRTPDIQFWIPQFPHTLTFENVETPIRFDIPGTHDIYTRNFTFTDYAPSMTKRTFKIDWSRFKCLEKLILIVWDVDMTGLNLSSLKEGYYIDTYSSTINTLVSTGDHWSSMKN